MTGLKFRQAAIYDIPAIARIENVSFVHPWSAEEITRDVLSNDRAYVAVAELAGDVIGYADMWIVAGEAQLFNIVVDPACRGSSVGYMLLGHMLKVAAVNCSVITLEVRRSNIPAINLYLRRGFRQTGVRKAYYRDNNEDAILMDRDLSDADTQADTEAGTGIEIDTEISTEYEVSGEDDSLEVDIETI